MRIRPMEERDIAGAAAAAFAAFSDLNARMGEPPPRRTGPSSADVRYRRLLSTDPGGAWVAEDGGALIGVAIAIVREGLWGLSQFVVVPEAQSRGVGRELLARAWAYGERADGHVILASRDVRALRSYVRLGLDLHPALEARGRPRGGDAPLGEVRPWRPADRDWADDLARSVRGAAHGGDLDALLAAGETLTVLPERGYSSARGPALKLVVAADDEAARTLLAAHLATARDEPVTVEWITGRQQWAVRACVDAGLELHAHGAVLTKGRIGPFAPYLPNGAYL